MQDSKKASFVNATSGLEAYNYKSGKKSWVPCDPLAFAAALDASIVAKSEDVWCSVETADASKRGQTYFGNQQHSNTKEGSKICRVHQVNIQQFADMLDLATNM